MEGLLVKNGTGSHFLGGFGKKRTGTIFRQRAQASLEMTVAIIGSLLLLLGSLKLFIWLNERLVGRHLKYNDTRANAASDNPDAAYEPTQKLSIFK